MSAMSGSVPDDLVVVRFSPFTAEGMKRHAEKDRVKDLAAELPPQWRISVFGTIRTEGETLSEAGQRLCVDLLEVDGAPNGERISVVSAGTLGREGFSVYLDEPPRGHYVVGVGDLTQMPDFEALSQCFGPNTRHKNPAFEKGVRNG